MKIGVIGVGEIGGTLARKWRAATQSLRVANPRGAEAVRPFAQEIGATAVDIYGAVEGAEIVVLAGSARENASISLEAFGGDIRRGRRQFPGTEPAGEDLLAGRCCLGRPGHVWVARCWGCRRKTLLPADAILARFGEHAPLHIVAHRLRCATCQHLEAQIYLGELPDLEPNTRAHQRQPPA